MELFITGVKQLPNVQSDILSKAVAIKDQNHELLDVLEKIASQVNPEIKDNGMYVVWIEPEHDMPVSSVPRMRSFYNRIRCLRRDTNKLDRFFKYLKCNIIESAKC
ncbi:Prolactin [Fukomys damarensis]|uniref:Prolactin n=2 Tax=Fukomys damarensis TaxID=885580 RepID=A0A091DZJ1_FUKDA|nr:Prolactin [Fukomys damarensis]